MDGVGRMRVLLMLGGLIDDGYKTKVRTNS